MPDILFFISFFLLGAVTGLCAGLFGIGGGGIMVPMLTLLFAAHQFPDTHLVHLALGTSMAAIVPTALASVRAHHRHRAVLWPFVIRIAPGIILGTFAATFVASYLPAEPLAIFFSCFMACVALQMILDRRPAPTRQLPAAPTLAGVGVGIGGVSALVAIGGGTLTVPLLTWCNVSLPVAIGTSAAVGVPIAVAGAAGYLINGWTVAGLPDFTLGFIYWPAVVAMSLMSFITAPLGAKLAHRLPVSHLKKMFAALLIALSLQMLYTLTTATVASPPAKCQSQNHC
jgi:uncharacterized protein